jgi:peptide/nickel transport system permease protein
VQAIELILRRVVLMIVILFAVSFLTFLIVHVLPGDVANAILGDLATPDQVELVRERMGLNEPVLLRYWHWVTAFASGDFGVSLAYNTPIAPLVFERLSNSVLLALISLAVAVPVSVALGVLAAMYQGSIVDRIITGTVVLFFALPEYVVALMLILIFSIWLGWLPGSSLIPPGASVLGNFPAIVLPVTVVTVGMLAYLSQVTRASMVAALRANYVRTADLKGLPGYIVVVKHALRNAMLPALVEIGLNFGYTLGGLVIVETVFSYAGIGQLLMMAVQSRDIPTIQAVVIVIAAAYGIGNLIADVISIALNPKLRT